MNLRQAISQATKNSDLDTAVYGIQESLGVTTGDTAGRMFSSTADGDAFNDEYWPQASPQERLAALLYYVKMEIMHMNSEFGIEDPGPTKSGYNEAFDPYEDPETRAMLERAGIATHRHRR